MKKALVLGLLVFGLGVAAYAGPVSGTWETYGRVTASPALSLSAFQSVLDVQYSISGWTLGSTAVFGATSFSDLFFYASGAMGAFSFASVIDFSPAVPLFGEWASTANVSIAGVTVFGNFMVKNFSTTTTPLIGTGAVLGLIAEVGDISVHAQSYFNTATLGVYYWAYGYDYIVGKLHYQNSCDTYFGAWTTPSATFWGVQTAGCTLSWLGADIWVDFPFTCVDVTAYVAFTCASGFSGFGFWITGIDSGLGWLTIDEVDIDFTIDSKTVTTYFGLSFGDWGCVKPYFSLEGAGAKVEGITLNALLLSYSFNGLTFKAGEIFDNTWWSTLNNSIYTYGFSRTGSITSSCIYNEIYDEYVGVTIDGDSCCGAGFVVNVIAFFDAGSTETPAIFDFQELIGSVSLGIGPNTTLYFGASMLDTGLNFLEAGVQFKF